MVAISGKSLRRDLEGLGLEDDVHNLLTNYSLEVHASISLKPLADAAEAGRSGRRRSLDRLRL